MKGHLRSKDLLQEFMRYILVGGFAFIVDFAVLYLFKEYLLRDSVFSLYVATAFGFICGLIANYILSLHYVFSIAKGTNIGRSTKDFVVFSIIGILGLILTEIGMHVGSHVMEFNYLLVKIAVTGFVLLWNYSARKMLIFQKRSIKNG